MKMMHLMCTLMLVSLKFSIFKKNDFYDFKRIPGQNN